MSEAFKGRCGCVFGLVRLAQFVAPHFDQPQTLYVIQADYMRDSWRHVMPVIEDE